MNTSKEPEEDGAAAEAPGPKTPVERLLRCPLYPAALPRLGNARLSGILPGDSLTAQKCLLRFGRTGP